MRRNMKFLLLFAILASSILAVYFIGGCEGDTTNITVPDNRNDTTVNVNIDSTRDTTIVIEEIETDDEVVGSVQGIVTDGYDNRPLAGVTVTMTKNDQVWTRTTDALGYYLFDDSLSTGYYELTFAISSHTVRHSSVWIPTIEDLRGDDTQGENAGDEEYMATENAMLYELIGTVTGVVYTALPNPVDKEGMPILAADDPSLVSRAAGVTVVLDFEHYDFQNDKFVATTNDQGVYTFPNVPLIFNPDYYDAPEKDAPALAQNGSCNIMLVVLPFSSNDSAFAQVDYELCTINPEGVTTNVPPIYAPLVGDDPVITNRPTILTYNFERPGFLVGDDLVFTFSSPMDSVTMDFDFDFGDYSYTWDATYQTLTVNPALDLVPDESYDIEIDGWGLNGLRLYDATWERDLYTQQGMRFSATNLDDYGGTNDTVDFTNIPLDIAISLTFDMNVDLSQSSIVLTDNDGAGREVNIAVSGDGTSTVTITPVELLESWNSYDLEFEIYSDLRNDYVTDNEVASGDLDFRTLWTGAPMAQVVNFAIDYDVMGTGWVADWTTDSVSFRWDKVPGADHYEIFALDNKANTDRVLVTDNIQDISFHSWQTGYVDFSVSPNTQFDLFDDDGILTPFSDSTEITFYVRAVDPLGEAGPFSAAIVIGDETAPVFTLTQTGDADNAAGAEASTFDIDITMEEYLDSVAFEFIEGGGDPAFVLDPTDVTWMWAVDMRDGSGEVSVAAGATGSVDTLIVWLWDNSGNLGKDTIQLTPWIEIDMPNDTTMDFMAPNYTVMWTSVDPNNVYQTLDMYFSLDGGTTWFDTLFNTADDGSQTVTVDDTLYSTMAVIGLQDTTSGGWIWTSQEFIWNGIKLLGPDSAAYDTMQFIFDEGGIDSTGIPVSFASAGLDSVVIVYSLTGAGGSYTNVSDTIEISTATDTTNFTWYPDDRGADYTCYLGVRDLDGTRPIHTFGWAFDVTHDFVNITAPTAGICIAGGLTGGSEYSITWDTVFFAASSGIDIEYSVDSGGTWITIGDSTANDGSFAWATPAMTPADDSAWVRFRTWDTLQVLDAVGPFDISGIVIDTPTDTTEWVGGASQNITWHTYCSPGTVDLYFSHDGFVGDSTLIVANTPDDGTHTWSVPNTADSTVWIRAWTNTDATYAQAGPFLIAGLLVTSPNGGEVLSSAGTHTITWTQVGSAIDSVEIEYSIDGGGWISVANDTNSGSYSWTVPNTPDDSVGVRVSRIGDNLGADVSDAPFTIAGIIVTAPNGGETWNLNNPEDITWTEVSITSNVQIEYTLNLTDWFPVPGATNIAAGTETFNWDLDPSGDPNLATSANCLIRVTEVAGDNMTDASNTTFTIAP